MIITQAKPKLPFSHTADIIHFKTDYHLRLLRVEEQEETLGNEGEPDQIPQEDSEDWPLLSPSVVASNGTLEPPRDDNNNPISPPTLRRSKRACRL